MICRFKFKVVLMASLIILVFPTTYINAGTPADSQLATIVDVHRVESDLDQLRADLQTASSEIKGGLVEIETAQLKQIEILENVRSDIKSNFKLHWREIGWGDVTTILGFIFAAITAFVQIRKYHDGRDKERRDRHREILIAEKESQWKRIQFLFEQEKAFYGDNDISNIISIIEGYEGEERILLANALTTFLNQEKRVTVEEGSLLRKTDRFLNHLELLAVAWKKEILTTEEVSVFAHYLSLANDKTFPELQEFTAKYYPDVKELSKAL